MYLKNKRFDMAICIYTLLVCQYVCLWTINVKTAEPIGPKFCVGAYMTPGNVYESSELQKLSQHFFDFRKIFEISEKNL